MCGCLRSVSFKDRGVHRCIQVTFGTFTWKTCLLIFRFICVSNSRQIMIFSAMHWPLLIMVNHRYRMKWLLLYPIHFLHLALICGLFCPLCSYRIFPFPCLFCRLHRNNFSYRNTMAIMNNSYSIFRNVHFFWTIYLYPVFIYLRQCGNGRWVSGGELSFSNRGTWSSGIIFGFLLFQVIRYLFLHFNCIPSEFVSFHLNAFFFRVTFPFYFQRLRGRQWCPYCFSCVLVLVLFFLFVHLPNGYLWSILFLVFCQCFFQWYRFRTYGWAFHVSLHSFYSGGKRFSVCCHRFLGFMILVVGIWW